MELIVGARYTTQNHNVNQEFPSKPSFEGGDKGIREEERSGGFIDFYNMWTKAPLELIEQ
jgi:hypothetical protein